MTARCRVGSLLLGAAALFLQGLYLPCQPMAVLLAVIFVALRAEPVTAGCYGWLLGLLWGLMAGLPPFRLGLALAGAAVGTALLHHFLIFTPGRLTLWTAALVIGFAFVVQWGQSGRLFFCLLLTLLSAPLCLWGAP